MKYLVTGGAGFIGTNLCKRLLELKHEVLCLDDMSTGLHTNIKQFEDEPRFTFIEHDITKPYFPDEIDAIFNLACPASPVHYQYNPIRTLKMGTLAMYNILGMAARLNVPILQASTSEVYGDPKVHPQVEDYWGNVNPIGPRACYDEGKRVAEALCVAYRDYSGVKIRIARIFNTFGPFMDKNDGRVVSNFIVQAINKEPLTIYGEGKQTRSFCFVDDMVDGLIKLMNTDYEYPVNLGNDSEISISELSQLIGKEFDYELKVNYHSLPIDDPVRRKPDISLAKNLLDWTPKIEIAEGIKKTIVWFKKINEI